MVQKKNVIVQNSTSLKKNFYLPFWIFQIFSLRNIKYIFALVESAGSLLLKNAWVHGV